MRKFARLPPGMMNEPLYPFYSQIFILTIKRKETREIQRGKRDEALFSFPIPCVRPRVSASVVVDSQA